MFIQDAETVASDAMKQINPELVERYVQVIRFLTYYPEAASALRGSKAPVVGSELYIRQQADLFARSRAPRRPKEPETVPDDIVSVILTGYFGIPLDSTERIKREHQLSMAAENMVGDLLERYLAHILEPIGWIWCSGALVRAVDFIQPPPLGKDEWRMLQVKNRDNSENSSSSAIRLGTKIEKWHRTFSRTGAANWLAFPDLIVREHLSEEGFRRFVFNYLHWLRL